jgi:hypothetical protein
MLTPTIENLYTELEQTDINAPEFDMIVDTIIEKLEEQLKGVC